jgi:hypothetical protein
MISFDQAVLQLRPEFVLRLSQIDAVKDMFVLTCTLKNTYFSTIPMDIIGIILEFIPDLRKSFNNVEFQQELERTTDEIYSIINKYCPNVIKLDENTVLTMNYRKLQQDYPDLVGNNWIMFKILDGKMTLYQSIHTMYFTYYIGNNTVFNISNNTITCEGELIQKTNIKCSIIPCNLLPCGLLLCINVKNTEKKYLLDPYTNKYFRIKPINVSIFKIIDDFGNLIQALPTIALASKYCCNFQAAHLEM